MDEKLIKLFQICSKNDVSFYLKKTELVNEISYNKEKKLLHISIFNPEDKNFEQEIDKMISYLEQLFK